MEQLKKLPALLLPWYAEHKRDLPWRADKEPYHVWLSEVMLQQTRVEAVKGYYTRFLQQLPTVAALAEADEEQCHKLWEGLGYYSRIRNLQKGAKQVMEEFGGQFPRDYAAIRSLCGIGDYTAGAIASICFGLPTPAVDGNVIRVMARLLLLDAPANDPKLKKELTAMLQEIYPAHACGDFTQALMELGATVCLPNGQPRCESCPIAELCFAKKEGKQLEYPKKAPKKPRKVQEKTVFILQTAEKTAISQRPETGLLAGLWEFPNVEGHLSVEQAMQQLDGWEVHPVRPEKIVEKVHIFTHVEWKMKGFYVQCSALPEKFTWATEEELDTVYTLPTAFRQFREEGL